MFAVKRPYDASPPIVAALISVLQFPGSTVQYRTLKTYHHGYNLAQSVRTCLVKPLSAVFRI